jgi:SNF2 family DNA or RNA helicase
MAQTFIIGIVDDNIFGPLLRPLIIDKLEEKGFLPIEAQLSELNYPHYEPVLSPVQSKIYAIASEYSEKNLFRIFSGKKDQTVKDFLNRVKKEEVETRIRPFIEKKIAKITDLLRDTDIELYHKDKHKFINRDNRVEVLKEQAATLFNIEKGKEQTRYNLSLQLGGEEIHLLNKPHMILSHDPCRMIIEDRLFAFGDVDASKLKPFFKKEYIIVPRHFEKQWFQTFALPNIKKYRVNATGFDIEKLEPQKQPWLELTHDLSYQPALMLSFYYGGERFFPGSGQSTKVILEYEQDKYCFYKIERDRRWEQEKASALERMGLTNPRGSYFDVPENTDSGMLYENHLARLVQWLKNHLAELEEQGFYLDRSLNEKKYSLCKFRMESEISDSQDWFDVKALVKVGDYSFPFVKLKKYILQGIREIQLPDGQYALLPEEWFSDYADLFKFGKVDEDQLKVNKHHFKILEKSLGHFEDRYLDRLQELSEDLSREEIEAPEELLAMLRPYQLKGYRWMHLLKRHHFGGCLADDMGLGKTVQTLTLLLDVKKTEQKVDIPVATKRQSGQLSLFDEPGVTGGTTDTLEKTTPVSLIVMPTSLIYNWEDEINKFTPQISFYRYTGMNRTRRVDELFQYDLILTTYGIVRNDYEMLKQIAFHYIILDESQYIKNPSSKIYKAVNELHSKHKLVLTGTPIENSLSDLWAQFNFLNNGLLGSYHFFRNEFILPIEKHNDQEQEIKLQSLIDPFILRRTKHQVAKELPEKTEQVVYCEMTDAQWSFYEREKSGIRNAIIEQLEEGETNNNLKILEGLSKLRQIANHPGMVDEEYGDDSGKFNEVLDYLESLISEEHKVLIFSSYKKHLRLLEDYLQQAGWQYCMLTGETHDRQKVINEFQEQAHKKIFLIQIKAGGFGLNLTAADYVLILDPWWNPAVEEQAVNRAHRIGQDKKVMVYRFISTGTVEEKIRRLQNKKARLAESFITPSESFRKLTRDEVMELFS